MQGKCFGIVIGCCLLAGCVIKRIDRTESTIEKYKGIRNCTFETVEPLLIIADTKADERMLAYTDAQHFPVSIDDFVGSPLAVPGDRTKLIEQIAPAGTRFRIVRIVEYQGPEMDYDRFYGKLLGGESDGEVMDVDWLFLQSSGPQKRIEPILKFIRRVESKDE